MNIKKISPKSLVFPNRLDIACKYLFFKELDATVPNQYIIDLYKEHILKRSGGIEGGDRWIKGPSGKNSIDDYISCAKLLHQSMKLYGFNKDYPIPYYIDRIGIENGAHRLSCALALNIDIYAMKVIPKRYKSWDEKWFKKKGFSQDDIDLLNKTHKMLSI